MSEVSSARANPDGTFEKPYGPGVKWSYERGVDFNFEHPQSPSKVDRVVVMGVVQNFSRR
jgi:hypothetical protein